MSNCSVNRIILLSSLLQFILLPSISSAYEFSTFAGQEERIFEYASPGYIRASETTEWISIYGITKSTSGRMWLSGFSGIHYYDGHKFQQLDYLDAEQNEFSHGYTLSIAAGEDSIIWAGVARAGVIRIDEKSRRFEYLSHDPNNKNSLSHNNVHSIYPDKDGGVWFGSDAGLNYYHIASKTFKHFTQNSKTSNKFNVIRPGQPGQLLLGTKDGIYSFDITNKTFKDLSGTGSITLKGKNVRDIYPDNKGRLWVGTWDSGIFLVESDQQVKKLADFRRNRFIQKIDNEIWVGTRTRGLAIFDFESATLKKNESGDRYRPESQWGNYVASIYRDENDLVWLGHGMGGLWLVPPSRRHSRYMLYSPSVQKPTFKDDISSIAEVNGHEIWLASQSKGIDVFSKDLGYQYSITRRNKDVLDLPSDNITAMINSIQDDVYIGTINKGMYRYSKNLSEASTTWTGQKCTDETGKSPNYIARMVKLPDGGIIAIQSGQSYIVDQTRAEKCRLEVLQLPAEGKIVHATVLEEGYMLLISYSDFYALNTETREVQLLKYDIEGLNGKKRPNFGLSSTLNNGDVILYDNRYSYLFTPRNDGSYSARLLHENQAPGKILFHNGEDISWGQGMYWDRKNNSSRSLSSSDGYTNDVGAYVGHVNLNNGDIVFGSWRGMQVFRPGEISNWVTHPKLLINEVEIDGESSKDELDHIVLAAGKTDLSILYSALEFTDQKLIKYRYYLEGYSKTWIETDHKLRRASFTGLPPGNYSFKLESSNRMGQWIDNQITIPVTVQPMWFQTIYFYIFVGLLIASFLYVVYLWRLSYYRRKKIELENLVEERTRDLKETQTALMESEKQAALGRLVKGMAHEINTPLGIAKMALSVLQKNAIELFQAFKIDVIEDKQVATRYNKVVDSHKLLDGNIVRLTNLVDKFKKISTDKNDWKFEQVNVNDIVDILPEYFSKQLAELEINLIIEADKKYTVYSSKELIQNIILELVGNAIQHAFSNQQQNPEIKVSVSSASALGITKANDRALQITVSDNGSGIDNSLIDRVFDPFTSNKTSDLGIGLHVLINLIENVLSGKISCINLAPEGCQFTVTIPNITEST